MTCGSQSCAKQFQRYGEESLIEIGQSGGDIDVFLLSVKVICRYMTDMLVVAVKCL